MARRTRPCTCRRPRVTTSRRPVKKAAVYAGKPGAADPRRCYVRTPLDEHSPDHQRTRIGRRAGPAGGRRAAALDRGRAVRPRRDAALRPHALRVRDRGGAEGRGLLSRAPSRGLRVDARPLHGGRARSTSSPSPSTCARAAGSRRRAARRRSTALTAAVPAVGNLRQYAQIVRDRALLRRLLAASYEIQASVHGHDGGPREIVEWAERAMLEVAHDDRQKDFRRVGEVLHAEVRKWQELSAEGRSTHRHPVRLRRPRRRSPAASSPAT